MTLELIKKHIAKLLGEDVDEINVIKGDNDQYLVSTSHFENYVYSEIENALINFNSLSNKIRTTQKYFTEEEKDQYFRENQGLIGYTLNKMCIRDGIEYDELKDVCIFGFAKALNSFNKNEGIKFSTYCVRCMINELYYYLRKEQRKLANSISFDKQLTNEKDGSSVSIGDLIDSKINGELGVEHRALNSELRNILLNCIEYLEDEEKYLIIYRYGLDNNIVLTQNVIAEHLNMSQANISKLEKTCLKKLRILMKKEHYTYDMKNKRLLPSTDYTFDTGADEKYNYLETNSIDNVMFIAAERLHLELDEIVDVRKTENKNEFIVFFKTNTRVYGLVNTITTHVELKPKQLNTEERFIELVLNKPVLLTPTREDLETDIYNVDINHNIFENAFKTLSKDEMYVLNHMFGLHNEKQLLTHDITKKMNKDINEITKLRKSGMKKLNDTIKTANY